VWGLSSELAGSTRAVAARESRVGNVGAVRHGDGAGFGPVSAAVGGALDPDIPLAVFDRRTADDGAIGKYERLSLMGPRMPSGKGSAALQVRPSSVLTLRTPVQVLGRVPNL